MFVVRPKWYYKWRTHQRTHDNNKLQMNVQNILKKDVNKLTNTARVYKDILT